MMSRIGTRALRAAVALAAGAGVVAALPTPAVADELVCPQVGDPGDPLVCVTTYPNDPHPVPRTLVAVSVGGVSAGVYVAPFAGHVLSSNHACVHQYVTSEVPTSICTPGD